MNQFSTDRLLFGGDYNPEQWPENVWAEDVELMRRAGVNAATIGVFAWSLLEPEEGVYDFEWMDRIIATLHDGGIGVILATPTASPPPWFTRLHPDAMPLRADGVRLGHGSRDTYSISASAYREACRRIATALAERYGNHPALIAWHVHNEYGTYDWGDQAARAFRRWLRQKYGSLEALNRAWYTAFWSQHYASWEDVLPPRATQYLANPTQAIDYKRFMSDEMLDALCEQRDAIRAAGSKAPITTNFMLPTWNNIEQWEWSRSLDFVSLDHYLDTIGPDGEAHAAYGSDLIRSWGGGRCWLLMEQSTISTTVAGRCASKEPDRMIRNSLSYVAHGSQGALFFQWRAPAAGAEVWHGGMVPHVGADSATFRGFEKLGRMLKALQEVAAPPAKGPVVSAEVAILWHADGWWALENRHLPHDALDYATVVRGAHRALWRQGVPVDFAAPEDDLSRYRLVIVPALFAMPEAVVTNLRTFVGGGGSLVVWPFTGIADEHLHVVAGGYPGQLRELLGIRVEELRPLEGDESVALSNGALGSLWSERVSADSDAVVIEATYDGGTLDGSAAITCHAYGTGTAYYSSTMLRPESLDRWLREIRERLGIKPVLGVEAIEGVEIVVRRGREADYVFVLNHEIERVLVRGPGYDLLTSTSAKNGLEVSRGEVAVLRTTDASPDGGWVVSR